MRHRVKKIKISKGKDHNRSMVRKLILNFLAHGKIETTLKRAKVLKSEIDRLVSKAVKGTESSRNVILRKLADPVWVKFLQDTVAPVFKDRTGGYVRIKRIGFRKGDNSLMARLEWVEPVVGKNENKKDKKKEPVKKGEKLEKKVESKKK